MPETVERDPERLQLRKELSLKYRSQSSFVLLNGKASSEIAAEIVALRNRLKVVDKNSIGNEYEDKPVKPGMPRTMRTKKRQKGSWYCANQQCGVLIQVGREKVVFKKRHYCSLNCAVSGSDVNLSSKK